ncbi:hypothetical protein AB0E27_31410 [Streptomyces sparsogenes]|uniref:hypothetical protein n=1 Tax=Streptomyces sparsogenes TaxID=67365 RepID=UPI003400115F
MATVKTVWHRPEFKDRESELINLSEAGRVVGVTRAAVSNWSRRHEDFPELVLEIGFTKWVVRAEFLEWEKRHRTRPSLRGPKGPRRPLREVVTERIEVLERAIPELEQRQKKQAEALARTTARLKEVRAELRGAQETLQGL